MGKSRIDFIKELLENKGIKLDQRERILGLASKELDQSENLEARIKKIEEKLSIQTNDSSSNRNSKSIKYPEIQIPSERKLIVNSDLPKYIDPYSVYEFLFQYNQNPVLRSTCHDLSMSDLDRINKYCETDSYDFQMHLKKIIEAFELHEDRYYGGGKINALIRAYLTGRNFDKSIKKDGWTTDKILVNWSSPELLEWVKNNPGIPPNLNSTEMSNQEIEPFSVKKKIDSIITEYSIQSFTELVLHFKNLFHIKSGPQSLREILSRVNKLRKFEDEIDFVIKPERFPSTIDHFTNVDALVQAYVKIIKLIIEKNDDGERPIVELRFKEVKNAVYFSVHHLNGKFKKSINSLMNRIGNGLNDLIHLQINGLCNLYLRADFGVHGFAQINLWNGKKIRVKKLDEFHGVEHVFEFPKIKKS